MEGPEPAAAGPAVVTAADMVAGHVSLDVSCLDRLYLNVILSFRVSQGCDLRRPVVNSVVDGTAAA
jgi:hypothetical protein